MLMQIAVKTTIFLLIGFFLASCSSAPVADRQSSTPADTGSEPTAMPSLPPTEIAKAAVVLPDLGPAPDFTNEVWLNTDQPLNLASLQGKVVLVEFWTFG